MSDGELRAYLLGHMPTAAADRLEEAALDDQEVFDSLTGAEDELFDDYAHSRLSRGERERFLERYGGQVERLSFARALAAHSAASRPVNVLTATLARRWVWLPAAAAIVLVVGGLLRRPATDLVPVPHAASATQAPVPAAVLVHLTLGGSRSAGDRAPILVPPAAGAVEAHVRLDPADRFDRYAIELRAGNAIVWQRRDLPLSIEQGEPVVVASIAAAALPDGAYEMAVRGVNGRGGLDDLGFVTLTVRRGR